MNTPRAANLTVDTGYVLEEPRPTVFGWKRRPLVYVAGPYRSERGMYGVDANIQYARDLSRILWKNGFAVICPHSNSAFMDGSDIDPHEFLAGDIEMVIRCDAVLMIGEWWDSEGAVNEHDHAEAFGIPIYEDIAELIDERDTITIVEVKHA